MTLSSSTCRVCGRPLQGRLCLACVWEDATEPADSHANAALPGHEILRELGRGGMGVVYLARQISPAREVAVKMLLPWQNDSPQVRERFLLEVQALSQLDHPAILPLYQTGETDGIPWFSMKFAGGGMLADRAKSQAGQWREIAGLVVDLAGAVDFAHSRGVLHRDLKPANILFDTAGQPYVADFGLAKFADGVEGAGLTRSRLILGTPQYLAPEVAETGALRATIRGDVYGLGAILYEMLAQRPPFVAESQTALLAAIRNDLPPPLRGRNTVSSLTPPLDLEVIAQKALSKEPSARYASAGELADDLRRWLAGEPITARPLSQAARLQRWAKRHKLLVALLVTLCAGVAGQWYQLRRTRTAQREAEGLVSYLNETLAEKLTRIGRVELMNDVNQRVREYYQHANNRNDPGFLAQLTHFYLNSARVSAKQGLAAEAEEAARAAQAHAARLVQATAGKDADALSAEADAWDFPAFELTDDSQPRSGAEAEFDRALTLRKQALALRPQDESLQIALHLQRCRRAERMMKFGDRAAIEAELESMAKELAGRGDPGQTVAWRELFAQLCFCQGKAALARNDGEMAERHFRGFQAVYERLATEFPDDPRWWRELAIAHNRVGQAQYVKGRSDEQVLELEAECALRERLIRHDPGNVEWRGEAAVSASFLARMLAERGVGGHPLREDTFDRLWQSSSELCQLVLAYPSNGAWRYYLELTLDTFQNAIFVQWRELQGALHEYAALMDAIEQRAQAEAKRMPGSRDWWDIVRGGVLIQRAWFFTNTGRFEEAASQSDESLKVRLRLWTLFPENHSLRDRIAKVFNHQMENAVKAGRPEDGLQALGRALDWWTTLPSDKRVVAWIMRRNAAKLLTETVSLDRKMRSDMAKQALPMLFPDGWEKGFPSNNLSEARALEQASRTLAQP